jgi:rhombotail lipoprotein
MPRTGGFDTRHGNVTLMRENVELRQAATDGFTGATLQMIEHFDAAPTRFEGDVRNGTANVRVVSNRGGAGGGGSLEGLALIPLLLLAALRIYGERSC